MRYRGRVKFFNKDKNFGFIASENNEIGDVFLSGYQLEKEGYKTPLDENKTVEFSIYKSAKGFKAINIDVITSNKVKHHTEDKFAWCYEGEELEKAFIREIVPKLERNLIIHPDKAHNPTSIDLYNLDTKEEADLKTQNTPFFTSAFVGNKLDPQYTVTFNKKDYERYKQLYPNVIIYYYVNWQQIEYKELSVEPLEGVWEVPFQKMQEAIENGKVYLHEYQNRINDHVNAKESYLFDLRKFTRLL